MANRRIRKKKVTMQIESLTKRIKMVTNPSSEIEKIIRPKLDELLNKLSGFSVRKSSEKRKMRKFVKEEFYYSFRKIKRCRRTVLDNGAFDLTSATTGYLSGAHVITNSFGENLEENKTKPSPIAYLGFPVNTEKLLKDTALLESAIPSRNSLILFDRRLFLKKSVKRLIIAVCKKFNSYYGNNSMNYMNVIMHPSSYRNLTEFLLMRGKQYSDELINHIVDWCNNRDIVLFSSDPEDVSEGKFMCKKDVILDVYYMNLVQGNYMPPDNNRFKYEAMDIKDLLEEEREMRESILLDIEKFTPGHENKKDLIIDSDDLGNVVFRLHKLRIDSSANKRKYREKFGNFFISYCEKGYLDKPVFVTGKKNISRSAYNMAVVLGRLLFLNNCSYGMCVNEELTHSIIGLGSVPEDKIEFVYGGMNYDE